MQDADLFLELAAIAGVFVGFGALIAVRSGGVSEAHEVAPMRAVVWIGVVAIIAALAPVTLGRYDLTDHHVWLLSSVVVLAVYCAVGIVSIRTPEYKAVVVATRLGWREVVEGVGTLLIVAVPALVLIAIALGMAPDLEAALYFTVVVLFLLQAAWTLLALVFMQRRPATA